MKHTLITFLALLLAPPLWAADSKPTDQRGDTWTKELKDDAKPTSLQNAGQNVRGDSGRWSDNDQLLHAPPIAQRPMNMPLDDWIDSLRERDFQAAADDDNWLLLRSRQLDDNDRLWIERIERRGNQFTVVANRAKWKGNYFRNFTYYPVVGVNLGKLVSGKYQVKWVLKPVVFNQFDGDGSPRGNWPKEIIETGKKPAVLSVSFDVIDGK